MEKPARRPQGFKNNFESALQNYQRPNALNIIYWIYWIYDVLLIPKNISNYMYVYTYIYMYRSNLQNMDRNQTKICPGKKFVTNEYPGKIYIQYTLI